MDADVVTGSVTDWTVTIDDQRRLRRALVYLRVRSGAYWLVALGVPVLGAGFVWLGVQDAFGGVVSDTFGIAASVALGVLVLPFNVAMPLVTVRRRIERELPVGATLTAWATGSGLGVRTRSRLTFYPWSRLTEVEAGPVLVRCRQKSPRTLTVSEYLPAGPDEVAQSIDFPAQLIGPEIRRELEARADRKPAEIPMAGVPTVVDRALRWRLVRAWIRAQFGVAAWLLPAATILNIAMQPAIGSFLGVFFFAALATLGLPAWWLTGKRRMSGIYPIGAAVTGSAGEWLEVQGPWGSVAWPPGWLKPIRMTTHTVTYEMVQAHPDGTLAESDGVEKRIVVIPRAFLDAPEPAVRAEA